MIITLTALTLARRATQRQFLVIGSSIGSTARMMHCMNAVSGADT